MAFGVKSGKQLTTNDGIPYLWESGDVTTEATYATNFTATTNRRNLAIAHGKIAVGIENQSSPFTDDSVRIYDLDGTQVATAQPSGYSSEAYFAADVYMGNHKILAGAWGDDDEGGNAGALYTFDLDGTNENKITSPNSGLYLGGFHENYNAIVDNYIFAATTGSRSLFRFNIDGTNEKYVPVGLSENPSQLVAGDGFVITSYSSYDGSGTDRGLVHVYDYGLNLKQQIDPGDLSDYDNFGERIAVGGGRIVVATHPQNPANFNTNNNTSYLYIYNYNLQLIKKVPVLTSNKLGDSDVALDVGFGRIVFGSPNNAGLVYVFDLDGNEIQQITPDGGGGEHVAIGPGKIAFTGGSQEIYVYDIPTIFTPYDARALEKGNK